MAIELKDRAALQELRELVIDNWKHMKEERGELEQTWKRCVNAFLCTFDKEWVEYAKQAKRSHRYVALSWDAANTLSPQIVAAATGHQDWLDIMPGRVGFDESDDVWAEAMKHLLKYQMEQGKFTKTATLAAKSLVILGNCPCSTKWDVRRAVNYEKFADAMHEWTRKTAEYNAEYADIGRQYLEIRRQYQLMGQPPPPPPQFAPPAKPPKDLHILFQGPVLQIGSIFNYVQEQHPNDEAGALRIMRSWRTKAYLKKMAKRSEDGYRLYSNLDQIKDMESEERQEDNDGEHMLKLALGMQLPHNKDKVHLKEQHGTFELNGPHGEKGLYENWIVTLANDGTIIRAEPTALDSGRPMIWNARLGLVEGAVYGIGPIEKALDEQDSANAVHNQTIDAVNTTIQPEFEVVEDLLADGVMKPSGPGVKHYVTDAGAITPIVKNFQGVPLGMKELEIIIARFERITGAVDTSGQSDETATMTARNTSILNAKLGQHVADFEEELISEALTTFIEMSAQYLTTDQIARVTQDKRLVEVDVPLEFIRRGGLVIARGSKLMAEKEQRIQELMMALQMAEQREANGVPSPVNTDVLWRQLMTEILGEAGEIVKTKEEYQQELEQWRLAQQQQAMMEAVNSGQAEGGTGAASGGPSAGSLGAVVPIS